MKLKWDIFCDIVDNFGDIGVCWRLARQLTNEYNIDVRLWINDLGVAKKLITNLDINKSSQTINGIEVCNWHAFFEDATTQPTNTPSPAPQVADVVIEAFACKLPATYLSNMADKPPAWVNLEYLSAENWVDDFHAQSSIQPKTGLKKYFFFPGFNENTGGLIREQNLIAERDTFQSSASMQKVFWQSIGVETSSAIKVSLFCYPHAPITSLLDCMATSSTPVLCLVPEGSILPTIATYFKKNTVTVGERVSKANLSLQIIPFLSQQVYDQLLWACDINFVRGEDSWVRAIWAAKPFIWQPYHQEENVHITKLQAFLDCYSAHMPLDAQQTLRHGHLEWCGDNFTQAGWQEILSTLTKLQSLTAAQSNALAKQPDLATKLVIFCKNILK